MLIDFIVMNISQEDLKSFRVEIYPFKEITGIIYNWFKIAEQNYLKF